MVSETLPRRLRTAAGGDAAAQQVGQGDQQLAGSVEGGDVQVRAANYYLEFSYVLSLLGYVICVYDNGEYEEASGGGTLCSEPR